jgi:hypothetical protein
MRERWSRISPALQPGYLLSIAEGPVCGVIFTENGIFRAALIPYSVVEQRAKFIECTHRFVCMAMCGFAGRP